MFTKHFIALAFICALSVAAYSQNGVKIDLPQRGINLYDNNGKLFVNPGVDIEGTPFFNDKWKYGTIKLTNDRSYDNVQLRLNLLSQEVHFISEDKSEKSVLPGAITEVIFIDSVGREKIQYDFKCGYSPVDNQNEKNFYLVLSQGKLNLLKALRKQVREQKDVLSGDVKKEYVDYENYYLLQNNNLKQVKLNKTFLLELMHDQQIKIEDFVKSNKLSYKSGTDLKKIAGYYNTL